MFGGTRVQSPCAWRGPVSISSALRLLSLSASDTVSQCRRTSPRATIEGTPGRDGLATRLNDLTTTIASPARWQSTRLTGPAAERETLGLISHVGNFNNH